MSHWKVKSESNFNATNILNLESFFTSSIHCSYYSCVQLMYHILSSHFNKSDFEISDDSFEGATKHKGMHAWIINMITNEIGGYSDGNQFATIISDLQRLRIKSDYKNKHISDKEADDARNYAVITRQILNRNFRT